MDQNDRRAIEDLFGMLGQAAQAQPHRDPEAEALIGELIARNPGAAYYLAQTVIVQEQALAAAEGRMQQLEAQSQGHGGGGFLGRLFGGGQPQPLSAPRAAVRPAHTGQQHGHSAQPNAGPWNSGRPGGGGFMAGAAQTAMGVAGGVLLGNAIGGMFAGQAEASEPGAEAGMEDEAAFDDAGFDDGGFEE